MAAPCKNNGGITTTGTSNLTAGAVQGTGNWDNQGTTLLSGSTVGLTGNINNTGTFQNNAAGTTTVTNAAFTNAGGTVRSAAGNLAFDGGFVQTAGSSRLAGGDITVSTGDMVINGGNVGGVGTVFGNVVLNGGSFTPGASPGTTTVAGNFTQTGGTLGIELGGNAQGVSFDLLDVTGNVTINPGSTLGVSLFGDFVGSVGDLFEVINFGGAFTGTFDSFSFPSTHSIGTTLLPSSFELAFLGITLPPTPSGDFIDLLNEIAILQDNQDKLYRRGRY